MDSRAILKTLRENGFKKVSQKGSHVKLTDGKKTVIVPVHGSNDIPLGTLKNIEKQSGVSLC